MNNTENARKFYALHDHPDPLVLFNVWDTATAKAVSKMGGKAIATGSWSIAAAHGYSDGQNIPLDIVAFIVAQIVKSVDVPVSVDFECGYAENLNSLADNLMKIIDTGAVGVNFEDQIIGQTGLRSASNQARKIQVLADTASKSGVKIFLNARTDLFLQEQNSNLHNSLMSNAMERAKTYADAGATGFFIPGLSDDKLIETVCSEVSLPVNIMAGSTKIDTKSFKSLGVSRISFGPHPFFDHVAAFEAAAGDVFK